MIYYNRWAEYKKKIYFEFRLVNLSLVYRLSITLSSLFLSATWWKWKVGNISLWIDSIRGVEFLWSDCFTTHRRL